MTRKLFWLVMLAISLFAVDAAAYGTYRLRSTEANEAGGQWHIYLRIDLPNAPSLPHMPMKFSFTLLTEYERALTDGSKDPVLNRIPMQNQLPKIESLDVDFADGTGKIFKTTNYDFSLTRARGYEAGEWKMQVKTSDGQDVGTPQTVTLHGDNPVVDRRSISFATKPKETKKDAGTEVAQNDTAPTSTEVTPVGTAPPFIPAEGFQKTDEEQIHTKPGGCGCDIPGPTQSGLAVFVTGAALALLAIRRKRA
jgi:hypothetical protein